jgi:hypothetical protein
MACSWCGIHRGSSPARFSVGIRLPGHPDDRRPGRSEVRRRRRYRHEAHCEAMDARHLVRLIEGFAVGEITVEGSSLNGYQRR